MQTCFPASSTTTQACREEKHDFPEGLLSMDVLRLTFVPVPSCLTLFLRQLMCGGFCLSTAGVSESAWNSAPRHLKAVLSRLISIQVSMRSSMPPWTLQMGKLLTKKTRARSPGSKGRGGSSEYLFSLLSSPQTISISLVSL